MESIIQWISIAREAILQTLSLISYYDLLIFFGCFLCFALFYFLSCIACNVRFFIPQFLKIIAYIILLITPFCVLYVNQGILYKNEVQYKMAKPLEYTPTFFVDGTIINRGKKEIKHCIFVLEVLRNPNKEKNILLNWIKPLKSYYYEIKSPLKVGESFNFQKTFDNFPYSYFQTKVFCYGGR